MISAALKKKEDEVFFPFCTFLCCGLGSVLGWRATGRHGSIQLRGRASASEAGAGSIVSFCSSLTFPFLLFPSLSRWMASIQYGVPSYGCQHQQWQGMAGWGLAYLAECQRRVVPFLAVCLTLTSPQKSPPGPHPPSTTPATSPPSLWLCRVAPTAVVFPLSARSLTGLAAEGSVAGWVGR